MQFLFLDQTGIDKQVFYDFHGKASIYNSLETAKEMMTRNGIPGENVNLFEVKDGPRIKQEAKIDLAISLLSWGFHYPVSTYLDQAHKLLRPGGVLIMDIRQGTDGRKELESRFGPSEVISSEEKKVRVRAVKSSN